MIPDIAVIISTYALARLLNEYVIVGEPVHQLRVFVSILAAIVIVVFMISVIGASRSISGL